MAQKCTPGHWTSGDDGIQQNWVVATEIFWTCSPLQKNWGRSINQPILTSIFFQRGQNSKAPTSNKTVVDVFKGVKIQKHQLATVPTSYLIIFSNKTVVEKSPKCWNYRTEVTTSTRDRPRFLCCDRSRCWSRATWKIVVVTPSCVTTGSCRILWKICFVRKNIYILHKRSAKWFLLSLLFLAQLSAVLVQFGLSSAHLQKHVEPQTDIKNGVDSPVWFFGGQPKGGLLMDFNFHRQSKCCNPNSFELIIPFFKEISSPSLNMNRSTWTAHAGGRSRVESSSEAGWSFFCFMKFCFTRIWYHISLKFESILHLKSDVFKGLIEKLGRSVFNSCGFFHIGNLLKAMAAAAVRSTVGNNSCVMMSHVMMQIHSSTHEPWAASKSYTQRNGLKKNRGFHRWLHRKLDRNCNISYILLSCSFAEIWLASQGYKSTSSQAGRWISRHGVSTLKDLEVL